MKKCTILAIGITMITLFVCVFAMLTVPVFLNQPLSIVAQLHSVLMRPFAYEFIIPVVSTILLILAFTGKITLGLCGLLTLANLCFFGSCLAGMGGYFFNISAWFFNMQDLILRISPVWFTSMLALGIYKQKIIVCVIGAFGLILQGLLQTVGISMFANTQVIGVAFNIVTAVLPALMIILAIYDFASIKKDQGV